MLLTIDVGNTNLCFGVYEGETLKGSFRLSTDPGRTADELGLLLCGNFQRFSLPLDKVEDVIISSVVPQVMGPLEGSESAYLGRRALVVDRDVDPGLKMAVEGKERLGSDRSVACVAAVRKYGGPCLLLDFGTATTLDAINEEGAYLGGCIAPGLGISMNALTQGAALLPQVELACPGKVLDCTTVGQIQAGVVLLASCFLAGYLLTVRATSITPVMYVAFALVGLAWAAINVNSLPMVVEMCKGSDVGKFTGYYYTASMAAQVITPVLAGTLMKEISYRILFPYAAFFVAMSFVTMLFVKHGDSRAEAKTGLEAFEDMDD